MSISSLRLSMKKPFHRQDVAPIRPSALFTLMLISALLAFELFNFSTTDYALRDLLGDLRLGSLHWATILALAFCSMDFAGVARLIAPDARRSQQQETWYLFGAWLLAATINALLTWWGVSMAIAGHALKSSAVINAQTLTVFVPVFVAVMVWVIRILIIGSLTSALEQVWKANRAEPSIERTTPARTENRPASQPVYTPRPVQTASMRQAPRPAPKTACSNRELVYRRSLEGDAHPNTNRKM